MGGKSCGPLPALHPQPLPREPAVARGSSRTGCHRRSLDRRTLSEPGLILCVLRWGPARWLELGAGRVGEGRNRQRPLGACGHGLSYPSADFAALGTPAAGGYRAGGLLEVLETSAGPVSPQLFLPSRGSGPHRGEHPGVGTGRSWGTQAARGQPPSTPPLLHSSTPPCTDPFTLILRQRVLNRSLSPLPVPHLGAPKGHGALERGGGAPGWALADLGLDLSCGQQWGCVGDGDAEAAGLGRQRGSPCCWRGQRQGQGFGQLHGATVPAGKSLFGEENVRDLPKGSSEGKGRAEGCDVPWGGGEELPGWTGALLGLGLR